MDIKKLEKMCDVIADDLEVINGCTDKWLFNRKANKPYLWLGEGKIKDSDSEIYYSVVKEIKEGRYLLIGYRKNEFYLDVFKGRRDT